MIRKSDKYCLQYENEKALKTNKDPGLKNNIDYHAAKIPLLVLLVLRRDDRKLKHNENTK